MPELPSGTVTFLFTDIEGSTALWERDRHAMAQAVAQHIAVLGAAIQAHGGVHFKTVGDAVQAAFTTAPPAVAAALAGQRALLAEDWGWFGALPVRMALHAGEAAPDDRGDYLAAPLNRLSRLLATGHGGQILLSQAVQQLSRSALPDGAALCDLGEHRLRDLLEPERVFQLQHPELPEDFPPLRTLDARRHNLPVQPTPFLGREQEVGEVVALLRRPEIRLLTLVGPGGTGKTRLALQAATEVLDAFPDGVFVVMLASLTDPALVPSAMAIALGIREEGERSLRDRLREELAPCRCLLVLDNVEHLIEATPFVGDLLEGSPELRVLTTSRVPLRLRAEREYPVPPLGLPPRRPQLAMEELVRYEAVRLFIERAQAIHPSFVADTRNAPAIAEICHRLDGLPLAIELAAARVRLLPPRALLARLQMRLPVLTGGARDAPPRHQTLRNTIAWSYDLLGPVDQTLFRRLAAFSGGVTLDAVGVVCDPDGDLDAFEGLASLVAQSLVQQATGPGDEPRFSMLETIREFALDSLISSGDEVTTRSHHAEYFLELAERVEGLLRGDDQRAWLDRLEAEHDNFRAALRWFQAHGELARALRLASALRRFWGMRGYIQEGHDWFEQLLAMDGEAGTFERVRALHGAGNLSLSRGNNARAHQLFAEALDLIRETGEDRERANVLSDLGIAVFGLGDPVRARECFDEALLVARSAGDRWVEGNVLNNLGLLALEERDLDRARSFIEATVTIGQEIGDVWGSIYNLVSLGDVLESCGEHTAAIARYREALLLGRQLDDNVAVGLTLRAIAAMVGRAKQFAVSARLFGAAEQIREAHGASWLPYESPSRDADLAAVRRALGDGEFLQAWNLGNEQEIEESVAVAIAISAHLTNGKN